MTAFDDNFMASFFFRNDVSLLARQPSSNQDDFRNNFTTGDGDDILERHEESKDITEYDYDYVRNQQKPQTVENNSSFMRPSVSTTSSIYSPGYTSDN